MKAAYFPISKKAHGTVVSQVQGSFYMYVPSQWEMATCYTVVPSLIGWVYTQNDSWSETGLWDGNDAFKTPTSMLDLPSIAVISGLAKH